jgi:hypothetical protein
VARSLTDPSTTSDLSAYATWRDHSGDVDWARRKATKCHVVLFEAVCWDCAFRWYRMARVEGVVCLAASFKVGQHFRFLQQDSRTAFNLEAFHIELRVVSFIGLGAGFRYITPQAGRDWTFHPLHHIW